MKQVHLEQLTNEEIRICYRNLKEDILPKIVADFINKGEDDFEKMLKHGRVCRLLDRVVIRRFLYKTLKDFD